MINECEFAFYESGVRLGEVLDQSALSVGRRLVDALNRLDVAIRGLEQVFPEESRSFQRTWELLDECWSLAKKPSFVIGTPVHKCAENVRAIVAALSQKLAADQRESWYLLGLEITQLQPSLFEPNRKRSLSHKNPSRLRGLMARCDTDRKTVYPTAWANANFIQSFWATEAAARSWFRIEAGLNNLKHQLSASDEETSAPQVPEASDGEPQPQNQRRTIPPQQRTKPMSYREAAKWLGKGKGKDAAEWVSKCVNEGTILCEHKTRQKHVFDRQDFPQGNWQHIVPPFHSGQGDKSK